MKEKINKLISENIFENILINEPMKNHTTFKVGGPVDLMIIPNSQEEFIAAIRICREREIEFMIMGNGSNLLVRDGGIRGVVIKINKNLENMKIEGNKIIAEAGVVMPKLSNFAMENSLGGLEFAAGIPGTIGGGITMNAGAYGGEMKDVVESVKVLDSENNVVVYTNEEMNFRYRNSRVSDENLIVIEVTYNLEEKSKDEIKILVDDYTERRTSKQPLELPSGGSTFKRPEGYFAGKLIDDSGLRGIKYRGAQVSEKHCGFIVNVDNATCNDILTLIATVQKTVRDNFNVELEREIKLIGVE